MRTEQHGNLFAKLNYVNLSDGAVRDMRVRSGGSRNGGRSEHALSHVLGPGVWTAKLTKQLGGGETLNRGLVRKVRRPASSISGSPSG